MVKIRPVYQVVFPEITAETPEDLKMRQAEMNSSLDRLRETARGMGAVILGPMEPEEAQAPRPLARQEQAKVEAGKPQAKDSNPVPHVPGKTSSQTT